MAAQRGRYATSAWHRRGPRLLLGRSGSGHEDDLPRNREGIALAGDPRQDVHVLISQMHVAMIRAHNRLADRLRTDGVPDADLFDHARRELTCGGYGLPVRR